MTASSPPSRAESVPQLQIELLRDAHQAGQRLEAIAERTGSGQSREVAQRVEAILEQVQAQGDAALFELTERFDGVRPDPLRVPQEEIEAAWVATPPDLQEAWPWPTAGSWTSTNVNSPTTSPSRASMANA